MRLILFCEQTGARLDPKQSAAVCAAEHGCASHQNCPLIPNSSETNQQVSTLAPVEISS